MKKLNLVLGLMLMFGCGPVSPDNVSKESNISNDEPSTVSSLTVEVVPPFLPLQGNELRGKTVVIVKTNDCDEKLSSAIAEKLFSDERFQDRNRVYEFKIFLNNVPDLTDVYPKVINKGLSLNEWFFKQNKGFCSVIVKMPNQREPIIYHVNQETGFVE